MVFLIPSKSAEISVLKSCRIFDIKFCSIKITEIQFVTSQPMPKKFSIPSIFESPIIKSIKENRQKTDPRKKDLTPDVLDFAKVKFLIPRHFGFCYGVQNAIEIAYSAIDENPDKRIFLLSEMIHNPTVNDDLLARGVKFLFETDGSPIVPLSELTPNDVVVVPAFGTTLEMQAQLEDLGINPYSYNTTCPFVEKVWKRGSQLGDKGFTLVIHGKYKHEETRATFSHSAAHGPAIVVLNPQEAHLLAEYMTGTKDMAFFEADFGMKCTSGFNPQHDLSRFGVINQTTMLATETQEVMDILREASKKMFGEEELSNHFAETKDTLCYATYENQSATVALMEHDIDVAIVVGGYNSSNTMHIVELLEKKCPTFHIRDVNEIDGTKVIRHFDQWKKEILSTKNWLPLSGKPLNIAVTSGASCPDTLVDEVILKICELSDVELDISEVLNATFTKAGS